MQWILRLLPSENFFHCQYLDARVCGSIRGTVKTRLGCLAQHRSGRLLKTQEDADLRLLAFERPTQIAHLRHLNAACLDGEENLLRLAGVVVVEVQPPINAAVRAFLLLSRPRAD